MPHYTNARPGFTLMMCRGILREPFRLIDVGVQGGIHDRWRAFGDHLQLWGFDALREVIESLSREPHDAARIRYFNIGLGNYDGERLFEKVDNPYGSAFLPMTASEADIGRAASGEFPPNWRRVPIHRLDSLYAQGVIGQADFIKLDCEGFEIEIVKGGQNFLRESGIFGIESETHFFWHHQVPRSHFIELYEQLIPLGFEVFDLGFHRTPCKPLFKGFPVVSDGTVRYRSVGQPNTFDFLFLGPAFKATEHSLGIDTLIKMIAVCELYGLHDVALSMLFTHRNQLGTRLDIDEAADCLVRDTPDSKMTYKAYLSSQR